MEYTCEDELEEIESRLYSEAYHSKNLDESNISNVIFDTEQVHIQRKIRYFGYNNQEQHISVDKNNFISLETNEQLPTQPPVIQNNITVIPPRSIHLVPNNITVNQYTVPIIDVLPPLGNSEFLNSWIKTNQRRVNSNLHRRALRKRKKRVEKKKRQQEVISLLDDSDEECVIMSSMEENKDDRKTDGLIDDDDIIFIPPPPQEVINIDDETNTIEFNTIPGNTDNSIKSTGNDSQVNDIQNKSIELSSTSESSNDFLENTNISRDLNDFNFGLHGLDFNNSSQSEFIRPDNPGQPNDLCETESSTTCSNDPSTEFNNSVKTIVFSEVEFPKGDIFAENNLETFGSLITPKRIRKPNSNVSTNAEDDVIELYCSDDLISVLNIPDQCKILPNLSPMPPDNQNCLSKINVNKKEEINNIKKNNKSVLLNNKEEQISENKIKKKKNKKKKKKSKAKPPVTLIENFQNNVSGQLEIERNKDTISKINEGNNCDLVRSRRRKTLLETVVSCDEVITTKRKKKCSGNIFTIDNEKKSVKKKQSLPNSNNVDNESSDSCEIILAQPLETRITPEVPKDPVEFSDIIIIDEIIESSSDLENVKDSNCANVESINNYSQLNCQKSKFFTEQQHIVDVTTKFDIQMIQSTQSDNPEKWQILDSDRTRLFNSYTGPRCLRCKHSGHKVKNCTEKLEPPKCYLCGEINHQEPRCPNKICRQCGNKGDYSTSYCWSCFKFRHSQCHICKMKGHISKTCPDLWRRYHLTTDVGPLVQPRKSILKSRSQWWCSGCARKGHLEHECDYYTRMYPPTTPFVISYEDVFRNQDSTDKKSEIQKDVNSYKEIPSLLDITVSKPTTSTNSSNIQTVSSDKIANTSFLQATINTPQQNTICLQHNDGLPLPDYEILKEQTNSNSQRIICLQHAKGIPQPNYNCESENTTCNEDRFLESEIITNRKNQDCRSVTKDTTTDNLHISIPNNIQTFSHVITHNDEHKSEQNTTQNLLKTDSSPVDNIDRIDISKKMDSGKNIIMHKPSVDVKNFIQQELAYMEKNITEYTPRLLRDKYYKYNKLSNTKHSSTRVIKEKCFWFRALNMYIFGLHKFKGGNLHVNYLREYLANTKHNELNLSKRKSLFSSYSYIFGFNKHVNVSYPSILKLLIQKYDEGKINKHL